MAKLTKAQRAMEWLRTYLVGGDNGSRHPVTSVWTRGVGKTNRALSAARELGFVISERDMTIRVGGWRHDITPAGRAVLADVSGDRADG